VRETPREIKNHRVEVKRLGCNSKIARVLNKRQQSIQGIRQTSLRKSGVTEVNLDLEGADVIFLTQFVRKDTPRISEKDKRDKDAEIVTCSGVHAQKSGFSKLGDMFWRMGETSPAISKKEIREA